MQEMQAFVKKSCDCFDLLCHRRNFILQNQTPMLMKRILLSILSMAILFGCMPEKPGETTELGQLTPYSSALEILNGQVKSIHESAFWAHEENGQYIQDDKITKETDSLGARRDFRVHFDSSGMVVKVEHFDDEGNVSSFGERQIEDGKYVKAISTVNDTPRVVAVYSYDEEGNWKEGISYDAQTDTMTSRRVYQCDENGRIIRRTFFNSSGEQTYVTKFKLDSLGHTLYLEYLNPDGSVNSWWKREYNENGLPVTYNGMDSDGTDYHGEVKYLEFDGMGNWTRRVGLADGSVGMFIRSYEYY